MPKLNLNSLLDKFEKSQSNQINLKTNNEEINNKNSKNNNKVSPKYNLNI